MVDSGEKPAVGGAEVDLSAMFVDMQGYVGIAEQVPVRRLPELMNAYFEGCTNAIKAENGTLDKYIGDVIVAMFGAPVSFPDHALRACRAALQCQASLEKLRAKLQSDSQSWPDLAKQVRVRIGLNSGVAIVGNMGTATRFNYTMMGDNVNLAARLESGAKSYGVWILCSETTKIAAERAAPGEILFRSLGRIIVKGRAQPLELFEPLAFRNQASPALLECVQVFETGLSRWREKDWRGAASIFEKSARLERDQPGAAPEIKTNPSLVFLSMAQSFRDNPGTGPMVI